MIVSRVLRQVFYFPSVTFSFLSFLSFFYPRNLTVLVTYTSLLLSLQGHSGIKTVGRTCGITSQVILVCLKALGLIHHVRPFQAECSTQVPYLTSYSVIDQSYETMVVETRIK